MTAADTALARGFLFLFAVLDFLTPLCFLLLLFFALRPLASLSLSDGGVDAAVLASFAKTLQRVVVLVMAAILLPGAMATRERERVVYQIPGTLLCCVGLCCFSLHCIAMYLHWMYCIGLQTGYHQVYIC